MGNYMIIHGSYGNPYKNWFPWLFEKLQAQGKECLVPDFPTPHGQLYSMWEQLLSFYKDNGFIDENTTIITHSMSCMFVAKFCVLNNFKIRKFISVAGFNNIDFSSDPELAGRITNSFYLDDKKLEKFKELCSERVCFYSDNDPYVPLEKGKEFADVIDAKHMFMSGFGHFNWRTSQYEFKEILAEM